MTTPHTPSDKPEAILRAARALRSYYPDTYQHPDLIEALDVALRTLEFAAARAREAERPAYDRVDRLTFEKQRGFEDIVGRLLRSVLRHRERYVRAWVAATGVHPADAALVQQYDSPGGMVRTWIERKSDGVRLDAVGDLLDRALKRIVGNREQLRGEELDTLAVVLLEARTIVQGMRQPVVARDGAALQAWDGTADAFWQAVDAVRKDRDTEGDQAVLADVIAAAAVGYEHLAKDRESRPIPPADRESATARTVAVLHARAANLERELDLVYAQLTEMRVKLDMEELRRSHNEHGNDE